MVKIWNLPLAFLKIWHDYKLQGAGIYAALEIIESNQCTPHSKSEPIPYS